MRQLESRRLRDSVAALAGQGLRRPRHRKTQQRDVYELLPVENTNDVTSPSSFCFVEAAISVAAFPAGDQKFKISNKNQNMYNGLKPQQNSHSVHIKKANKDGDNDIDYCEKVSSLLL